MQSSHFGDGKHRRRPSWLNRARPGVRAAADGRLPSPRRSLHLTRFVSALVRGDAALLRRSGAGRAVEWPWQLDSHVRVSRPNGRSCRAPARTPQAKAARGHIPCHTQTRPCAIPTRRAAGGYERHEAGGAGAVGRAKRSAGDENSRQVSGYRHGGWRARPSVSRRERTGVRWRPRYAAGPCGPPITPLACVVVTRGATAADARCVVMLSSFLVGLEREKTVISTDDAS
jgi:hypothetical protein